MLLAAVAPGRPPSEIPVHITKTDLYPCFRPPAHCCNGLKLEAIIAYPKEYRNSLNMHTDSKIHFRLINPFTIGYYEF